MAEEGSASGTRLDDRAFRSERASGSDSQSSRQRLQESHAQPHSAVAEQDRFHRLRNAVSLQRRLPVVNHHPHDQSADRGDKDDPKPKMIVRGTGNSKGEFSVEAQVGEKINEFEQAFRHKTANQAHQ